MCDTRKPKAAKLEVHITAEDITASEVQLLLEELGWAVKEVKDEGKGDLTVEIPSVLLPSDTPSEHCEHYLKAKQSVQRTISATNGLLLLDQLNPGKLRIEGMTFRDREGNALIVPLLPATGLAGTVTYAQDQMLAKRKSLARSMKNSDARDALHYLSKGLVWFELYKAFEVVWKSAGRDELIQSGLISKSEFKRFKRTAQDPRLSHVGDQARHARYKQDKVEDPMTINEAYHVVSSLIQGWLENFILSEPSD